MVKKRNLTKSHGVCSVDRIIDFCRPIENKAVLRLKTKIKKTFLFSGPSTVSDLLPKMRNVACKHPGRKDLFSIDLGIPLNSSLHF